jgi:dihydroxy-acid dehydratase
MKSDQVKKGVERAPHRALLKACGYTDSEIQRPLIGIANSANSHHSRACSFEHPGRGGQSRHLHGRRHTGGVRRHRGLRRHCHEPRRHEILPGQPRSDRRFGGDHGHAHGLDAMVMIPNCDKIVPGMLMAAARLDCRPSSSAAAPCWPADIRSQPHGTNRSDHGVRGRGRGQIGRMNEEQLAASKKPPAPPADPAPACSRPIP